MSSSLSDSTGQPSTLPTLIATIVRQALTFGGGLLVANGVVSSTQEQDLIGGAMVLASVIWSVVQKMNAKKALVAAIAAPAGSAGTP